MAGYILAVDYIVVKDLIFLILGGYCIVGASNSFNQIIEKDKDKLMDRTKLRPLPTKKITTQNASILKRNYPTYSKLLCSVCQQHDPQ